MDQAHLPILLQAFSLALGLLGSVLGVLNAWSSWVKDKVRLKVVPKGYAALQGGLLRHSVARSSDDPSSTRVCIEVINIGSVPVTIEEVGFVLKTSSGNRAVITQPLLIDGGKFPRRLEARSAFTAYAAPDVEGKTPFHIIKKAYAETECGEIAYGSSPFLRNLIKLAKQRV